MSWKFLFHCPELSLVKFCLIFIYKSIFHKLAMFLSDSSLLHVHDTNNLKALRGMLMPCKLVVGFLCNTVLSFRMQFKMFHLLSLSQWIKTTQKRNKSEENIHTGVWKSPRPPYEIKRPMSKYVGDHCSLSCTPLSMSLLRAESTGPALQSL